MKWLIFIVALLLLLGPLRRHFFRQWRFTVPAVLWGFLAWIVLSGIMKPQDPWWMPWIVAICVALGAGTAGKQFFDEVFGKG